MGIKTRFNPMGGDANGGGEPRPSIPDYWSYTTRTNEAGKEVRTLYFYNNATGGNEVKVPYGYTELQDYSSTNYAYATLPFYKHTTLTSVDLKNVPFKNNSMSDTFSTCQNLTSVNGINKNVTNMYGTFYACRNLNQNIQIPNSVTNMYDTFSYCNKLNQNIQIPNSVTNMHDTFSFCFNLNQNIQIPNSITSMSFTFTSCYNLNQNIQIPNSITSMSRTFMDCSNLNQNIQIPNSVTYMGYTFYNCQNLGNYHKTIKILSEKVTNTANAFGDTSYHNISNQLTIVFPLRYINNVNTVTRNSLVAAGYAVGTGLGVTSANATENRNLLCWDIIPYQGYSTYTGNGTHWVLTKWDGRKGALPKNITVPARITSYATFPTAITKATFTANKVVTGIDCNHVPFNGTAVDNAFRNCTSVTYINNINIPYGVTTVKDLVSFDANLIKLSTGKGTDYTANLDLPDSVTNTQAVFARTKKISNYYLNSKSSTTLAYAMDYVNLIPWNLYVKSPNVTSTKNFCRGSNTAIRKNIYIYYKYANGVATKTFNAFKAAVYTSTTGNSGATSPMYNAKSNFYIYNLGTCPI